MIKASYLAVAKYYLETLHEDKAGVMVKGMQKDNWGLQAF